MVISQVSLIHSQRQRSWLQRLRGIVWGWQSFTAVIIVVTQRYWVKKNVAWREGIGVKENINCNHVSDSCHLKTITKALITQSSVAIFHDRLINPMSALQGMQTATEEVAWSSGSGGNRLRIRLRKKKNEIPLRAIDARRREKNLRSWIVDVVSVFRFVWSWTEVICEWPSCCDDVSVPICRSIHARAKFLSFS